MRYITIEGPDGTGKSTQAQLFYEYLKKKNPKSKVLLTKEPGSPHNKVCQEIRSTILNPESVICDKTALLLLLADKAQHIENVIKPFLAEDPKNIVLSDRSSLSTVIYHVAKILVNKIEKNYDLFYELIDFAQMIKPDLCLVANADFKWSMEKLRKRKKLDRIENFGEEFHKNVHSLFNEISTNPIPMSNNHIFGIRSRMSLFPNKIYLLPKSNENSVEVIQNKIINIWESL